MEKVFRIFENVMNAVMVLIGIVSLIVGFTTGMWHCFLICAMSFSIPYAIWKERKKNKH